MSIVLEQDCHRTSKIRQPQCLDIVSVDEYAPLRGVVYSSSKLENGAFSGSIRANYDLRHDVNEYCFMPPENIECVDVRKGGPAIL